jgi:NADH-quinone oxidoreductase subunit N
MNLGAFSVIIVLRRKEIIGDEINDLSGLMARAPAFAILMLIFLLSLAGIPPTAGFIGKYFIFLSLVQTGHYYLAVLGVVYAVVALYYYFRLVVVMFTKHPTNDTPYASSLGLRVALGVCVAATLLIGIFPQRLIELASEAIRPFLT